MRIYGITVIRFVVITFSIVYGYGVEIISINRRSEITFFFFCCIFSEKNGYYTRIHGELILNDEKKMCIHNFFFFLTMIIGQYTARNIKTKTRFLKSVAISLKHRNSHNLYIDNNSFNRKHNFSYLNQHQQLCVYRPGISNCILGQHIQYLRS